MGVAVVMLAVVGLPVLFFAGWLIGGACSVIDERTRAARAGAGRYVINPKTGEASFEYGQTK